MSTQVQGGVGRLVHAVRRRVRLRTRIRQALEWWRRTRRPPVWRERQPGIRRGRRGDRVTVEVAGVLARPLTGTTRGVTVVVADWQPPHPGWRGRPHRLPALVDHRVQLPTGRRGTATVSVTLAEPTPLPSVLAAVHPVLDPAAGAFTAGADPRGRQWYGPDLARGELHVADGAWRVLRSPGGAVLVAGRCGGPLDERQRTALARLGLVTWHARPAGDGGPGAPTGWSRDTDRAADEVAGALWRLAMTGVPVHAPEAGALPLPADLAEVLAAPVPGDDPMEWEIRSVRQRRVAMRALLGAPPPVSAVLVSKRPELLDRQVAALASQTYPDLEIVVGVHGAPPPPKLAEAAGGRPLQVVEVDASRPLGEALAEATAYAAGALVTKVDDDDFYGPEHVWDLVLAHRYAGATVAGKPADFVYLATEDLTVRRGMAAEVYSDVVAGGTILIDRQALLAVGGWPPVPRHVDRALLDRVLADGGVIYRTHPWGFVYTRHGEGHTWLADERYFRQGARQTWPGRPSFEELG